jgi:polar amino acid transport system permease protein
MDILRIFHQYHEALLSGLSVTLRLCLIVWSVGLLLGSGLGVVASRFDAVAGRSLRTLSLFASATPILVLLFWLHYPAQSILGIVVDPFITTCVALGVVNVIAVAEIVRVAIDKIPREFLVAAHVCGLNSRTTLVHIELPLLLRQIIPGLLMAQVYVLQASLFGSLISVEEIFRVAQRINAIEYRPVAIYTALAVLFWLVCLPLTALARRLERKYHHDISER